MKNNKYFFGWTNIKWVLTEFINLFSNRPSFFSKKRFESFISFFIGQLGMVVFLIINLQKMVTSDIVLWASVEFAIAGYIVSQIQKEKKSVNVTEEETP